MVNITTIMRGEIKLSFKIPLASPIFIIIKATSPLDIIPTPILEESRESNPKIFDVIKQAINLLNAAPINNIIVKIIIVLLKDESVVCIPILAKNIGENIK